MMHEPLYEDAIRVIQIVHIDVVLSSFDCLVPYARFVLYDPPDRFAILYSIYLTVSVSKVKTGGKMLYGFSRLSALTLGLMYSMA